MKVGIVGVGVAAVAVLAGCVRERPLPSLTDSGPQGKQLVLRLPHYPDGAPHALTEDLGSVVLLNVWATWCEPCKDALPMYQDFAKEYGPRGLRVYAINVDEDPRQIAAFLKETHVTLPILLDQNGDVAEHELGVKLMPTTFLVDRKGRLRHRHEGFAGEFLARYQSEIEQLLAEP